MTMPNVVGLDLSLTATGVAAGTKATTLKSSATGMARLVDLRDAVLAVCADADLVAVEGYSFGSRNSQAHALGELGGVVRVALHEAAIRYLDVSPATVKKYATGRGNAPKAEVYGAAIRRLGYQGCDHNQADALWLRALAMDGLGHPIALMPAAHRAALKPIDWATVRKETTPVGHRGPA